MDIDMSISNYILKPFADNKINSEAAALNRKQIFEQCKSLGCTADVIINVSKLFKEAQLERTNPDDGDSKVFPFKTKLEEYKIPEFLKATADDLTVADSIDEKLGDQYYSAHLDDLAEENTIEIQAKSCQEFKVAVTNNGTFMIFGISDTVIELNHEQTEILADFFKG